ncbi:MAG TPA: hypothetical protein VK897_26240 [Anaerolineales bacterium]|nr:hypothetical protein [Anaerolineales bacterium]
MLSKRGQKLCYPIGAQNFFGFSEAAHCPSHGGKVNGVGIPPDITSARCDSNEVNNLMTTFNPVMGDG